MGQLVGEPTSEQTNFRNGSSFAVLAASTRRTRGPHPQKLIIDEVDELKREIYDAAIQMPQDGDGIPSSMVIASTAHRSAGLMEMLVDSAADKGLPLYTWCWKEVAEQCVGRECKACALRNDCGGDLLAPKRGGYYSIEGLIRKRAQNDLETWETEWCCRRANVGALVYDPDALNRAIMPVARVLGAETVAGLDWGYVNPTCLVLAQECADCVEVYATHYWRMLTLERRLDLITEELRANGVREVYADASAPGENTALSDRGFSVIPVSFGDWKDANVASIRRYLEADLLRISHTQREFIEELRQLHHRPAGRDDQGRLRYHDEIAKINDHGPDALCALFKRYSLPEVAPPRGVLWAQVGGEMNW
jgi:hypothetical protein